MVPPFRDGKRLLALRGAVFGHPLGALLKGRAIEASRRQAVAIVRVVVVQRARRVDVTHVVSVRRVRGTEPPVPGGNYQAFPLLKRACFLARAVLRRCPTRP